MLQFYDESGVNNLPAGIQVLVYPSTGPQTSSTLIGSAWTQPGGFANIAVSTAVNYIAVFVGSQAPPTSQAFSGGSADPTVVIVDGYKSPSLTLQGYTQAQVNGWVRKWFGDSAGLPGGNAFALAEGLSAGLASADAATQAELARVRVQSCAGPDIDSWFRDFLGVDLLRYSGESDDAFMTRGLAMLVAPKCTLAAIQAIVVAFYAAIAQQLANDAAKNLAFDEFGAEDQSGAYDRAYTAPSAAAVTPDILVWDRQSRPDLANKYSVNPRNNDGTFVIQIGLKDQFGLAWFLNNSFLNDTTFLAAGLADISFSLTAPDPRLAALVNFVKAGGAKPLYAVYQEA